MHWLKGLGGSVGFYKVDWQLFSRSEWPYIEHPREFARAVLTEIDHNLHWMYT